MVLVWHLLPPKSQQASLCNADSHEIADAMSWAENGSLHLMAPDLQRTFYVIPTPSCIGFIIMKLSMHARLKTARPFGCVVNRLIPHVAVSSWERGLGQERQNYCMLASRNPIIEEPTF